MGTTIRGRFSTGQSNQKAYSQGNTDHASANQQTLADSSPIRPVNRTHLKKEGHKPPPTMRKVEGKSSGEFQVPTFHSLLFERPQPREGRKREVQSQPAFFTDLNLDQIIDAITAGREEFNLKPFFYTALSNIETIRFRHEIMQDLDNTEVFDLIKAFAEKMRSIREKHAQEEKLHYQYQQKRWFLDAVEIYCDAVNCLLHDLSFVELRSRGLAAFREWLTGYVDSECFETLAAETQQLITNLSSINYCLEVKGSRITVRKYGSEADYSAEVEQTFEKFKQGAVNDYRAQFYNPPEMNHIEAKILELVAQLFPEIFSRLDDYCAKNRAYMDELIARFDREVQFYVSYLEYIAKIKRAGLKFCYPQVSNQCKEVFSYAGYDLALANKLINDRQSVVCNDFYLEGKERIIVVSGPNQGGKTIFARTFGQLHYLASLGCPVPGDKAQLFLFDKLFTHFEKEENIQTLRGKLQDDLVRIHDILTQATPYSIIIINEIFTSTALKDALFLSKEVMAKIMQLDSLSVCVTFIDELASLSEKTVSMVSNIVPGDPTSRTYKIVRRAADGFAYALSIAEKYEVTYDSIKERVRS